MAPGSSTSAANGAGAAAADAAAANSSHKRGASEAGIDAGGGLAAVPDGAGAPPSPSAAGPGGGDAASADGKRRRTGPGSRGVANLTPEQLAKKRANDREAQRAIRERTRQQIESLENRIRELTSQQPYQELQAALRAKEAVEAENADIKRRLASVVALIQPLVASQPGQSGPGLACPGPGAWPAARPRPEAPPSSLASCPSAHTPPAEQAVYASPARASTPAPRPAAPAPAASVLTPSSGASPASLDPHGAGWSWPSLLQSGGPSPQPVAVHARLQQQRHELAHGLEFGAERLGLGFLLGPALRIPRLQAGSCGAQDTPQFHHVPMKHDWSSSAAAGPVYPVSAPAPAVAPPNPAPPPDCPYQDVVVPDRGFGPPAGGPPPPDYAVPIRNCAPTCLLDSVLLDFLRERRGRAAEGLPAHEVAGPRYPSVSSLLNPARSRFAHPLSKVFTDILGAFPELPGLPERVAVLYTVFLLMRWQVAPTRENHDRLPSFFVPRPVQRALPHPAWIDLMPFPAMRERLVREHGGPGELLLDNFFIPVVRTVCVNWPYDDADVLLAVPGDAEELLINPVFERHLRSLDNWTLGPEFADAFPGLRGTYKLRPDAG